jgi:hypothetical protein
MSTTHVFIVDINTFKYHLEYLFAGTGAKDNFVDFNNNTQTSLHPITENNLVSMIADLCRVRKDDFVIFYLQKEKNKVWEGKFYGIFQIKDDFPFLDNNDDDQFLKNELEKSLTFRTLIQPYEVYAEGVSEWEALDEIKDIQSPFKMLWSLIYRKLKGNRGNTMITIYESERLFELLRDKNNRQTLSGNKYTFDIQSQKIIASDTIYNYTGRKTRLDILPRLINKYPKPPETHLQAYIVQNIGKNTNPSLDSCLLNNLGFEWMGNEVSCGVGMQKIDIMLSLNIPNNRIIVPIELKAVEATEDNIIQVKRYVNWLEQYYIPNININITSDIQPVLISKTISDKNSAKYRDIVESFKIFNQTNNRCLPLKYIEYHLDNSNLLFEAINYDL